MIRLVDGLEIDHRTIVNKAICPKCGEKIYWEADFDANATTYHACCCELRFGLYPSTVIVSVESDESQT